jgi:hypothetical protein
LIGAFDAENRTSTQKYDAHVPRLRHIFWFIRKAVAESAMKRRHFV